jgi:DNA polymerase I
VALVVVDFETEGIGERPDAYPPRPVGVALRTRSRGLGIPQGYHAFGHGAENNTTRAAARALLARLWRDPGVELLFHNAPFDLEVALAHLDLPLPPWERIHDTLPLAFLDDPHRASLSLKPLAEKVLDLPPEEQDAVRDWVLANVPEARRSKRQWGAHIARAPGGLVGAYAIGDVVRTLGLFEHLHPRVRRAGMGPAYDRERALIPVLLEMERAGVPIQAAALERAVLGRYLARALQARDLDLDRHDDVADALERRDLVREWELTEHGARSVAVDALRTTCSDPLLVNVFDVRARVTNALRTFARPWLASAKRSDDGRTVYVKWNSTRQASERQVGRTFGARTGRLSTTPNFQNVPVSPPPLVFAGPLRGDALRLPVELRRAFAGGLPRLRDFVAGPRGTRVIKRDYSQQELRILGHYEGDALVAAYQAQPWLDLHDHARQRIWELRGVRYERKKVKNTGFGIIYGMGLPKLAAAIDGDVAEARAVRLAYKAIFPGLRRLEDELRELARRGEPLQTWGGRRYHVEPPKVIRGALRSFEYKQLNTLIQGSAGDVIKEVLLRYAATKPATRGARLFLTVHDETVALAPTASAAEEENRVLRDVMESVEFKVPLLSEGSIGPSWGRAKTVPPRRDREGSRYAR